MARRRVRELEGTKGVRAFVTEMRLTELVAWRRVRESVARKRVRE